MVQASFPWPLMAPLLLGMRYGFMRGMVSAVLLILALIAYHRYGDGLYPQVPASFIVGVLVSGMLVGEFRDIWERRRNGSTANDYRQLRLDEFTRAHYILRISHDRLEQRVAGNDQSLRSSLLGLRNQLRDLPRGDDALRALAEPVLGLLAQYGAFRAAALYRCATALRCPRAECHGRCRPARPRRLAHAHVPAARRACQHPRATDRARRASATFALPAVRPLIDTEGRFLAVLAIEQMPFFSFNDRVFGLLAILAGHIADLILSDPELLYLQDMDSQHFSQNLKRSASDARLHGLDASLFALQVKASANSDRLLRLIEDSRRGLDLQLRLTDRAATPACWCYCP